MLKKIAFGIAAGSLAFTAAPAFAQDEEEEARTTYRIEYLKLKPGSEERWVEMGEKYFGPASDKAGLPRPQIHWMMSGPWHVMMVFELPRGMAMLDSHNPPERVAWRNAFVEIAGGEDAAKKLREEDNSIVTGSLVTYSHTHP